MNESEYHQIFLETLASNGEYTPFLSDSKFFHEIPIRYEIGKMKRAKDLFMPDMKMDFLELDAHGSFHLWEAKLLESDELIKGKVLGQCMFYDFLFRTDEKRTWTKLSPCKDEPQSTREILESAPLKFKSWNILVCGGEGWELAAGVNPNIWTYTTIMEDYFSEESPDVSVYHLFETRNGWCIQNLWHLSVLRPKRMHPDAYEAYLKAECEHPALGVITEDVKDDMPFDLFMKFIGRSQPGGGSNSASEPRSDTP